ncbi:MAG: hydantoinase/oxoprolinase family protein [Pseudomonadota bacterium]
MRIGIDVGGTHTDVVVMSGSDVVLAHKTLTSDDIISGIRSAFGHLKTMGTDMTTVEAVMIGTTQFTNAVIARRDMTPVAALRLSLPSGRGLPPKIGWPTDLAVATGDCVHMLHGGYLYDGKPLADIDEDEIDRVIDDLKARKIKAIAVTSAFSPMTNTPEQHVADRIKATIPTARFTLSHQIGRIGLLERENAAILNAALLELADTVVDAFDQTVSEFGLNCPVFVSQNDGTLMKTDFVRTFPALTFSSGPTNSLRGAAKLTGREDAIVIDIGGTTSDIGVLRGGFPRESNMVVEVGGVRTNFRMPDVNAIGLGGGSVVKDGGHTIGPQSVGHSLVTKSLVFGGDTMTATDIIVAAGHAKIGDPSAAEQIPQDVVEAGLATIRRTLEDGLRTMKTSQEDVPVILVGGGAVLAPDELDGASEVIRPDHSGVANAIGASIALVGGEAERFVSYQSMNRDAAITEVTRDAQNVALAAGADPSTIRTTDVEETIIPYMDEGTARVRVKVVGDLSVMGSQKAV